MQFFKMKDFLTGLLIGICRWQHKVIDVLGLKLCFSISTLICLVKVVF